MKITRIIHAALATVIAGLPIAVAAVESPSFVIEPDENFFSIHHYTGSASFDLEGSIDPIAASVEGGAFRIDSGDAFSWYCGDGFIDPDEFCDPGEDLGGATCESEGFEGGGDLACDSTCTGFDTSACDDEAPSAGGGGGGGRTIGIIPEDPVFGSAFLTPGQFTYGSSILFYGTKTLSSTIVIVNDEIDNVTYPTDFTWQTLLTLQYGNNTFFFTAHNTGGDSNDVYYSIYRRLIGDINQDDTVNDYDLSRLVRLWGTGDDNGDFNLDGDCDDYDFSMMVSRWGMRV
jgi:hypothetical protein